MRAADAMAARTGDRSDVVDLRDERGRDAEAPTEVPATGWRDVASRVATSVREEDVPLAAAGVAYYGFLATIPALAAAIALYGLAVTPAEAARNVEDLFGVLPNDAQQLLTDQVRTIAGSSSAGLSLTALIGTITALWAASSGVSHLMQAVNQAYGERHTRKFLRQRGLALALTLGALVLGAIVLAALAAIPSLVADLATPIRVVAQVGAWAVAGAAFLVGLAVLYRVAPERDDPRWAWVTPGAVLALVLWLGASLGLRAYAASFGSYNETYGALAGVVLLLLWLYASGFVVLLAAEVNAELEHQTAKDTTQGPERPMGTRGAEMADTLGAPAS